MASSESDIRTKLIVSADAYKRLAISQELRSEQSNRPQKGRR